MNVKKHKPTIQLLAALFLILVGCGLLIAGFVVPPPGQIHNSVLIAFGQILTFAGALFGIDYHYAYRYHATRHSQPHNQSAAPNATDN